MNRVEGEERRRDGNGGEGKGVGEGRGGEGRGSEEGLLHTLTMERWVQKLPEIARMRKFSR